MGAPITYLANFVVEPDIAFQALREDLSWVRIETTPRSEYYCNDTAKPYTYGSGRGVRTYSPQPYHPTIMRIRESLEEMLSTKLDVCFLNRYHDQSDHLGWHADDSPEMDDERPIVTVSLGAEREIWFRQRLGYSCRKCHHVMRDVVPGTIDPCRDDDHHGDCDATSIAFGPVYDVHEVRLLQHGSACIMRPHMQETWQHRIPKASRIVGERISLTFRGYVVNP